MCIIVSQNGLDVSCSWGIGAGNELDITVVTVLCFTSEDTLYYFHATKNGCKLSVVLFWFGCEKKKMKTKLIEMQYRSSMRVLGGLWPPPGASDYVICAAMRLAVAIAEHVVEGRVANRSTYTRAILVAV
jgi:hypothetical protein